MHFVYALTSAGPDTFSAMTAVSVQALRRLHPEARVTIAVDEQTANAKIESLPWWPEKIQFLEVRTELKDPVGRNRFVKTKLPVLIDGAFAYLDGDTLPIRPLSGLFNHDGDFAGVPNRHRGAVYAQFPPEVHADYRSLGWSFPKGQYINGGVWYCGDSVPACRFRELYHERWCEYSDKTGIFRDQPSLNSALNSACIDAKMKVVNLPLKFNAFVDLAPCFANEANLWHFFARDGKPNPDLILSSLIDGLLNKGVIDWPALDAAVASSRPWTFESDCIFSPELPLELGRKARVAGDMEVAWRMVGDRIQRKTWSVRTWRMVILTSLSQVGHFLKSNSA